MPRNTEVSKVGEDGALLTNTVLDEIIGHLTRAEESEKQRYYILHAHADADALGSAYALSCAFPGKILIPDNLAATGKILQRSLNIETRLLGKTHINSDSKYFFLDVSSPSRISSIAKNIKDPIIIDHHDSQTPAQTPFFYCFDRSSTSEIIYEILERADASMPDDAMKALLLGIITDTGHFRFSNSNTFKTTARILSRLDMQMEPIMEILDGEKHVGEIIAVLRGLQRVKYRRVGNTLVAKSFVSCFESSTCEAILNAGASVVLVGSGKNGTFRLVARAKHSIQEDGLHLGEFCNKMGEELGFDGGGHSGAAGIAGEGNPKDILNLAFERIIGKVHTILEKNEFKK